MKIRAEDGRSISETDISFFINDLPNKKDTTSFSTEDASGSTSQAANIMESMESGTHTFLIDEDTSATNFMIRDELMQRVVLREKRTHHPFYRTGTLPLRNLWNFYGNRCRKFRFLFSGSRPCHPDGSVCSLRNYRNCKRSRCGLSFHHTAGCTGRQAPLSIASCVLFPCPGDRGRTKMKTLSKDAFSINRDTVDLRYVEQVDGFRAEPQLCLTVRSMPNPI